MAQVPNGVDSADWVTIWQSEWAAIAVDREVQENLVAATAMWNIALAGPDRPAGRPGADAPPGTAPAGHAPGAGQPRPGGA